MWISLVLSCLWFALSFRSGKFYRAMLCGDHTTDMVRPLILSSVVSTPLMSLLRWFPVAKLRIRKRGVSAFLFRQTDVEHPAALSFFRSWSPKPGSLPLTIFQSSHLVPLVFSPVQSYAEQEGRGRKGFMPRVQTTNPQITHSERKFSPI